MCKELNQPLERTAAQPHLGRISEEEEEKKSDKELREQRRTHATVSFGTVGWAAAEAELARSCLVNIFKLQSKQAFTFLSSTPGVHAPRLIYV